MEVEFIPELTDHTSQARARKIIKGKRTKRQRPCSPNCLIDQFMSSEEDEDMANCLIMLAQSESLFKEDESESKSDPIRQKTEEMITATRGGENEKSGLYVYECKTCNRTFPSFQALGGHRASHKKPKVNVEEKKSSSISVQYYSSDEENDQHKTVVAEEKENTLRTININNNLVKSSTPLLGLVQTGLTNNKTKVHECSICGSEFSSGQALGGHMRKHRPIAPSISRLTEKSEGGNSSCMLSLDLNFPPPEMVDDVVQSKFKFTNSSSQPHMVFSAPALVDCHY